MRFARWLYLLTFFVLPQSYLSAQGNADIKFGKITAADFDLSGESFDPSASALIISDVGSTRFEGNDCSGFDMIYSRRRRIKILNKNGFDIASYVISVRVNQRNENQLDKTEIKGCTYNLENGVMVKTELDPSSIYRVHDTKSDDLLKVTMPALKEGSIMEISYTVRSSNMTGIQPWEFQGKYPCLRSEYTITVPPVFHYVMRIKGDGQFDTDSVALVPVEYALSTLTKSGFNPISISGKSTQRHWVKKNIPGLKSEPYLSAVENYIPCVSFQLDYVKWRDNDDKENILPTWPITSEKMLQNENFGACLDQDNIWMVSKLKSITGSCKTDLEKTRQIYSFIRDQFTCNDFHRLWLTLPLKEIFKKMGGNVGEINMLLTAMLRKAGISADPAILSTRENGVACTDYPLLTDYNYMICVASIDGERYTLDASHPLLGFGKLEADCYNGKAIILNKDQPSYVDLKSDLLRESRTTTVFIVNDSAGHSAGSLQTVFNPVSSYMIRKEVRSGSVHAYFQNVLLKNRNDMNIENMNMDSLNDPDKPLAISYDFNLPSLDSVDILYFKPIMDGEKQENPFVAVNREYPVELPYQIDDIYILSVEVPARFKIDEFPKSARINLNGNDGFFEYIADIEGNTIQMRVRVKINRTYFPTSEYNSLREFYTNIKKKEDELITFKKKSKS